MEEEKEDGPNPQQQQQQQQPGEDAGEQDAGAQSQKKQRREEFAFEEGKVEGYLRKKNRWGFWVKRFFRLRGDKLEYFKDDKLNKQTILGSVIGVELDGRFGDFAVETESADKETASLTLRADDLFEARAWVKAIEKAESNALNASKDEDSDDDDGGNNDNNNATAAPATEAAAKTKKPPAATTTTTNSNKDMEGYLDIPSASRFKKWQHRYFRLRRNSLFYYKDQDEGHNNYEGEIVLEEPASESGATPVALAEEEGETVFAIYTKRRTYKFKAPTVDAAKDWVQILSSRYEAKRLRGDTAPPGGSNNNHNSSNYFDDAVNSQPEWMNRWDEEKQEDNVVRIQRHLEAFFPPGKQATLQATLDSVTLLMEELDHKAKECLPRVEDGRSMDRTEAGRMPRPDIFETLIRFYHLKIMNELSEFASDQNYDQLSNKELVKFMDLITAYDAKINEILVGDVGERIFRNIPQMALLDNADNMGIVYLKKCKAQIVSWVENIILKARTKGEALVEVRQDGRYQTSGPTDLFTVLNENLNFVKITGVRKLLASFLTLCAVTQCDYLHAIMKDLTQNQKESLPYCVATANDCWTILDHVDLFAAEQKDTAFEIDFDPVRERCGNHANKCLDVLAAMVRSDMRQPASRLFSHTYMSSTKDEDDFWAICLATMDDYLEDFSRLLEVAYYPRLARKIVRDMVGDYLGRMAQAYRDEGFASLSKKEIKEVENDKIRLVNALGMRFPNFSISAMFHHELQPLDDVLELLRTIPSGVPSTAMRIALREPFFKQHVINTAKMCLDFSCNGSDLRNDKLVKDVKGLILTTVEEKVPSKEGPVSEEVAAELDLNSYARMWPALRRPARIPAPALPPKVSEREADRMTVEKQCAAKFLQPVAASSRISMLVRQQSNNWRPPENVAVKRKQQQGSASPALGSTPPPPAATAAAAAVTATAAAAVAAATATTASSVGPAAPPPKLVPLLAGEMLYCEVTPTTGVASKPAKVKVQCLIEPLSETHQTDFVFLIRGKTGQLLFRVRISDIVKVEFWVKLPTPSPMHFGPNAVDVQDAPNAPGRFANNLVEFALRIRNNQILHFTADSEAMASRWVDQLRTLVLDSFRKWGSTYREGEEDYSKMTPKEMKRLALKRGLDTSLAVDTQDLVKILRTNYPPLEKGAPEPPEKNKVATDPFGDGVDRKKLFGSMESATPSPPPANSATPPIAAAAVAGASAAVVGASVAAATTTQPPPPVHAQSTRNLGAAQAPGTTAATTTQPPPPAHAQSTRNLGAAQPPAPQQQQPPLPASASVRNLPTQPQPAAQGAAAAATGAAVAASTLAAQQAPAAPDEVDLLVTQQLILRGLELLEENQPRDAERLFKQAKENAQVNQWVQLRAKATHGMACCYRDIESMRKAAGPTFEAAAMLFQKINETSDRINSTNEAVDVYLATGERDKAIKLMEKFDEMQRKLGQQPMYEQRLARVRG